MSILIDTPVLYPGRLGILHGRAFRSSHLISDLPGEEGHQELLAFARQIRMSVEWLQHTGNVFEHFDVMNSRYQVAIAAGAQVVTPAVLIKAMLAKRPQRRKAKAHAAA